MRASIILLALALAGCGEDALCENRIVERIPEPSGGFEAIVFERECSAPAEDSTHVSLGPPGMVPRGGGNVFVGTEGVPHAEWDGLEATARWLGPQRLEVIYDQASEVRHEQQYFEGVAVSYRRASTAADSSG